jgi:hypothetical protein
VFFLLNEDCRRLVLVRLEEEEAAPRLKRLLWVVTALLSSSLTSQTNFRRSRPFISWEFLTITTITSSSENCCREMKVKHASYIF